MRSAGRPMCLPLTVIVVVVPLITEPVGGTLPEAASAG